MDNASTIKFNKFRNYVGAQISFMCLHHALSMGGDPYQQVLNLVKPIITMQ